MPCVGDFEIFQKQTPIGVLRPMLETLSFFRKNPYRVGVHYVGDFVSFQKNPYMGGLSCVGGFEIFKKFL